MAVVNVVVVAGTRPEAIKLLPVIRRLRDSAGFRPVVVSTGQHAAMVREVLALDGILPDVELGVGRPGITLNELFAETVLGMDQELNRRFGFPAPIEERRLVGEHSYPAACLVHGDTSSAAAAALAAFHLRIPVGHIEAGLRTHSTSSPFPEELNRQLIARIATFHLAPTEASTENLILEGVPAERVFVTGNTGIDAVKWAATLNTGYDDPVLDSLDPSTEVVVVTAHRRENWGQGLRGIGTATRRLAEAHPEILFVLPLHPNPVVADTLRPLLADHPNVHLTAPMSYVPFSKLLARARLAISDSGGIQEEAPALATPVLVTRESTERSEGLLAGTLRLVGTDPDRIFTEAHLLLTDQAAWQSMATAANPYGDGHAAERIVDSFAHLAFNEQAPHPFGHGYRRQAVIAASGYHLGQITSEHLDSEPGPDAPEQHG